MDAAGAVDAVVSTAAVVVGAAVVDGAIVVVDESCVVLVDVDEPTVVGDDSDDDEPHAASTSAPLAIRMLSRLDARVTLTRLPHERMLWGDRRFMAARDQHHDPHRDQHRDPHRDRHRNQDRDQHGGVTNDDDATRVDRIRREPPRFRRCRVRSKAPLSDRMLRVVLGGDELAGFAIESPASSVRLLLPPAGAGEIEMPSWTGNQFELANGDRAPIRTFTPRAFDTERLELTLDIVLHDHGAATDWARRAHVGDEVAISGPGRSEALDPDARSFLLAGDESAIPAIAQLLESIDADRTVDVHIEITDPSARFELPEHPNASITWHDSIPGAAPGAAFAAAVEQLDLLPDAVWVAGEAAAVQRLRTHLFDERGRSRRDVTARGYWKLGRSAT